MAQSEQPSTGGEYSGAASASATWEDSVESPPRPFPQSFPEFSRSFSHRERFAGMNNQGFVMNNGASSGTRDDPKSCFVASTTFSLFGIIGNKINSLTCCSVLSIIVITLLENLEFCSRCKNTLNGVPRWGYTCIWLGPCSVAMTMAFGMYGSETLRLGPNTSMLLKPNHLFVESMKVVEVGAAKGSMLYGFYKIPPLDAMLTWPERHKISLPGRNHKEWVYYLNAGSQIDISYSVASPSPSSLLLVIAEGNTNLGEWLRDPLNPNPSLSWNIIHGNGSIQKYISESSIYYIGVGNLHPEVVKVTLNVGFKAFLYNTTESYYKCKPAEGKCTFQFFFLGGNTAVLTSPGHMHGMVSGDWYVQLSYGPRWFTYIVGTGGMIFLLVLINYFMNQFRRTERRTPIDQLGSIESERNPLLSHKDDNISSQGPSYASDSDHEGHEQHAHSAVEQGGKPVKDDEFNQRICAICFEAPKDSFFIPCGHCVACFRCATRILKTTEACPICRHKAENVRKIYTV